MPNLKNKILLFITVVSHKLSITATNWLATLASRFKKCRNLHRWHWLISNTNRTMTNYSQTRTVFEGRYWLHNFQPPLNNGSKLNADDLFHRFANRCESPLGWGVELCSCTKTTLTICYPLSIRKGIYHPLCVALPCNHIPLIDVMDNGYSTTLLPH